MSDLGDIPASEMTTRTWLVGQALTGLASCEDDSGTVRRAAVGFADAALAELSEAAETKVETEVDAASEWENGRLEGRREELERCCKLECCYCRNDISVHYDGARWAHQRTPIDPTACGASRLRGAPA